MLRFLPLAVFVLLVAFFLAGLGLDSRLVPSPLLNKPAPAFRLPALATNTPPVHSSALGGQVWLLNVWASWCVACRAEHALIQRLAGEGAYIVGLNYKDEEAAAKEWLETWQNPYQQVAVDRNGSIGLDWGVYGVPETFVIDAAGVIRHKHIGPLTEDDLQQTIRPLLVKLRAEIDA